MRPARLFPNPTGGATVTLRYAPEVDNRYPDSAFHDWPDQTKWLGELTGDRTLGQTFYSRYPNLNGITLRVATFGADTGTGEGTLKSGPDIEVLDASDRRQAGREGCRWHDSQGSGRRRRLDAGSAARWAERFHLARSVRLASRSIPQQHARCHADAVRGPLTGSSCDR